MLVVFSFEFQCSLSCAIVIHTIHVDFFQNKHCLLDLTPDGIEKLMFFQMCPIVILLKTVSKVAGKYVTFNNEFFLTCVRIPQGVCKTPCTLHVMKNVVSSVLHFGLLFILSDLPFVFLYFQLSFYLVVSVYPFLVSIPSFINL